MERAGAQQQFRGWWRSRRAAWRSCGPVPDDYEGISGYEEFHDDLRLLYLATTVGADTGHLAGSRVVPMRANRLRLCHTGRADTEHVHDVLGTISRPFGTRIDLTPDGVVELR